ncbi:MAG TPA: putative glycolipid-binding domain-containing protein [Ohtaekwangia sp.]
MQTNLLWTGREYYSLENCLVNTSSKGSEINSVIIGKYGATVYRVDYQIITDPDWQTVYCEIQSRHSNQSEHIRLESDGKGNWNRNGVHAPEFEGCLDVDIPLTPFTNTLPINRLRSAPGNEHRINVIYLDLLEQKITRVTQKYIRLSDTAYHYENVPNDFEANITVDESGFVVDYPSLFVRTAKLQTRYS